MIRRLPAVHERASDVYHLSLTAEEAFCDKLTGDTRRADTFAASPEGKSLALGARLGPLTISDRGNAVYARPRFRYAVQPDYAGRWTADFGEFVVGGGPRRIIISATAGYVRAPEVTLDIPDLSNVDGWTDSWLLRHAGSATAGANYVFHASSGVLLPLTAGVTIAPRLPEGNVFRHASHYDSYYAP